MISQQDAARDGLIAGWLAWLAGVSIGAINQWLQAGAFIVSMAAGTAATIYYIKKIRR